MFLWVSSQSRPTAKQSTLPNHTYREQNETVCRASRLFLSWHSVLNMYFLTLLSFLCHFTAKLLQHFFLPDYQHLPSVSSSTVCGHMTCFNLWVLTLAASICWNSIHTHFTTRLIHRGTFYCSDVGYVYGYWCISMNILVREEFDGKCVLLHFLTLIADFL